MMSWIVPVAVIVVFVGLLIDDLWGYLGRGGSTSSYDMVELMKRGRGRHE